MGGVDQPKLAASNSNVDDGIDLPAFRHRPAPTYRRRFGVGLILSAVCFITAASGWFWLASDVPSRTAFIFFSDSHPAPFPVLGWIEEDRARFEALDGLTLQVESAGFGNGLDSSPWARLENAVEGVRNQIRQSGVLIVNVRGQGCVTNNGEPALAPPNSDPFDSQTWIPLSVFCERTLQFATEAKHIQIVLDCLPRRAHWASGSLCNDFPAAVANWTNEADFSERFAKLTIVCRAGDGESRWRSHRRGGSILQQALWHGLAGDADDEGNRDGRVDTAELASFLIQKQSAGCQIDVARVNGKPHSLSRSLPIATRERLGNTFANSLAGTHPDVMINDAWKQCEVVLHGDVWEQDLLASGGLLRAMAAWEDNLWSGRAGNAESASTAREVDRRLQYLEKDSKAAVLPAAAYPILALQRCAGVDSEVYRSAELRRNEAAQADSMSILQTHVAAIKDDALLGETSFATMAACLANAAPAGTWSRPELVTQLLTQRTRFEDLAIAGDIRISRHVAPRLDSALDAQLAAFDQLQVGQTESLDDAALKLDVSRQQLEDCTAESETLKRLTKLSDRVRLELPFLAEWVACDDAVGNDAGARAVNKQLLPLIEALNRLDGELHSKPDSGGATLVVDRSNLVNDHWEEIRSRYEREWSNLLSRHSLTCAELDSLERLLQVPLLPRQDDASGRSPAEQRVALLQKLVTLVPVDANGEKESDSVHTGFEQVREQMVTNWMTHPALALVETEPSTNPAGGDRHEVDAWNRAFRGKIRTIEEPEQMTLDGQLHQHDETVARVLSSRRGLGFARTGDDEASKEFRRVAWTELLLQLAEYSLVESWGPLPGSFESVMEKSVDQLLTVASSLTSQQCEQTVRCRRDLAKKLRRIANGFATESSSLTPVDANDRLQTDVTVSTSTQSEAQWTGVGRLGVLHLSNHAPRHAIAVSLDDIHPSQPFEASLPIESTFVRDSFSSVDAPLLTELWFRGHRYSSNFRIIPAAGRTVETDVNAGATTFVVRSDRSQNAALTFILDCSASMQEPISREGSRGSVSKLTAATSALRSMLSSLAQKSDGNVGVMLYGHRVTYDPRSQKPLVQTRYTNAFPMRSAIRQYNDVETILPTGRFGPAELGQVSDRLDKLLPWGETPLYLAVSRAVVDLSRHSSGAEHHVVVITDGRNYQFNPPPAERVELRQAIASARAANVSVDVIGFGMSAREQQIARRDLDRLASETGGTSTLDVSEASGLIRRLNRLSAPTQFTWTTADGLRKRSDVNTPVVWDGSLPATVDVTYENTATPIELKGGESVELLGDAAPLGNGTLRSANYSDWHPRYVPLATKGQQTPVLIGVHQPRRAGNDVRFQFSLKCGDQRFLKRPSDVCVLIQPLSADGVPVGVPFRACSSTYSPGTPVPVLSVNAVEWPHDATNASVRLSIPRDVIDSLDGTENSYEEISLPFHAMDSWLELSGVEVSVRQTGRFVQCVLRHSANSLPTHFHRVELIGGPQVAKIRHQVDPVGKIEVHTFEYSRQEDAHAEACLAISKIQPSIRRAMMQPLRISINDDDSSIRPSAQPSRVAEALEVELRELALPVLR